MQNCLIRRIAKGDIKEADITLQRCIRHGAICLMRMLPCPHIRLFRCFLKHAILFRRIDQGDITLILLRLFIQQIKNALCPGKAHDNGIDLR